MNKRIIKRAVGLIIDYMIVGSTLVSIVSGFGEHPAYRWGAWDVVKGLAFLAVFAWSVIDIYRFHTSEEDS